MPWFSPFIRNAIFKVVSCTLLQLKHMLLPINLTTIIASSQKRNFGLSILVENWNLIISLSPQTISNPFEDRLQMKQVIYCRFMKTQNQFMTLNDLTIIVYTCFDIRSVTSTFFCVLVYHYNHIVYYMADIATHLLWILYMQSLKW